jgi:hypothetical protein
MQTKRWRTARRSGRSAQLFKEGDSEVAPVTFSYDHEASRSQRSSQVPMSVMLGDILRCWHRVPLEKVGAISESKGILVYRFELVTAL